MGLFGFLFNGDLTRSTKEMIKNETSGQGDYPGENENVVQPEAISYPTSSQGTD